MPTVTDIKAKAVEQTGLTDFGDDSFEEGLAILLSSLDSEARLNGRGEAFLYPRITGYLAQRLQVEDWYRRHPEIDEVPIDSPVIGLGLPRTGSTALSILLAQDPDVRYLRRWESSQPCPPPSTVLGADPRVPPDKGEMVGTRYHVPADTHGPMECHELMALDFKSHLFQSFAQVPAYSTWLVEKADLTPTLAYQRRVMKLLQWGEPDRPWRLKCPSHVLWLDAVSQAFPDARFVMTHRDPTDVILSVADLYADIIGTFTDEIDRPYIGRLNVEHWSLGMDRALQFRAGTGQDRFYDIDFRAMQVDPIGEVTGLYTWLGQPVTDEFAQRMDSWWTRAAAEREASSHADPALFGIDLDQVRPRFARYADHATRWTTHGS
ncbi:MULTISPECIES: sulfotransferase [unclassified Mycolicibacterium]|uniref:sulfotransferase family protein n=1 Tax=unclassified Mycolicibacterium TaxID=2636767 RepID=UPI0012DC4A2A|nr:MULTISPECIES: sulfotransferase [unclassified Mycolicibacterium]MUL85396.1 sulfotransferase [Mycolicibacterium sp. CBMA 329]MUL88840.1 sulfotransferase [Mycolicibacterium sp. CBMA 331]MUM01886.1 sulfotransferase [Mycolicibacterium sp. CBMA 334]MUM27613.1 sulfotransferase [Mycolicibacterium sp. CBMA 295]MUM40487.1 sulfotransferase [Mycolicibacterium sp. CBMA 247]